MVTPTSLSLYKLFDFHKTQQADATILLSSSTQGQDYGHVKLGDNQQIISFQEKFENSRRQLINAGVYCLQKELIQCQPEGPSSLEKDCFPQWLSSGRVFGMVLSESFYDIGTPDRFFHS